MKNKLLLYLFLAVGHQYIAANVLILTSAYNRPDFIEIQYKTLKFFLEDEHELVVFNDAQDHAMVNKINNMCQKLGLRCIRIPQEIHNKPYLQRMPGENYNYPSVRNVNVVQYSLDTIGFDHDGIVMLLDSDLFLVKKFSIKKFLKNYNLGGMQLGNGHVNYLWHGLAFLDMNTLPNKYSLNFNCGKIDGHPIDAGGYSHYYLKNNPKVNAHYVNYCYCGHLRCDNCKSIEQYLCAHNTENLIKEGFDKNQIEFIQAVTNVEFFYDNAFIHYRGGTNWDGKSQDYHNSKTAALQKYLNAILK